MRAVIQRVKEASVTIHGRITGEIKQGMLIFLGVGANDTADDVAYMVDKTAHLRIFQDEQDKMNLSLLDIKGSALVVSQFTLFGDCRKGRRPSFSSAALPQTAQRYYREFIQGLKKYNITVAEGVFREMMDVALTNDGPVTLLLDSTRRF